MNATEQVEQQKIDYKKVSQYLNRYFAIGTPEGNYVANHMWTLPSKWIAGFAQFIDDNATAEAGWICSNILHDIGGYVRKDAGFAPRCFRGGSVWDVKDKR